MENRTAYSWLDRLVHRLAFSRTGLQDIMADIEKNLLANQWAGVHAERPIFITSLPRAGTTMVLEALFRLPGLATHTYRDMPFVLAPVLWARLSRGFQRQSLQRERAHGDGLLVNEDSPEAFEEVLWRKYYPGKYTENRISLWHAEDVDAGFTQHFREHMQKIVALRQPLNLSDGRYVSKNNANIARIGALQIMFPDACIIVPLRHPIEHAISLWRQHRNFNKQHAIDPFVRKYMADIGHYEFGALHKPISFDGLQKLIEDLSPESLDYWLAYWIGAFEHLSAQQGLGVISYESLCTEGAQGLARLCNYVNIDANDDAIVRAASVFRAPSPNRSDAHHISRARMDRAMSLYKTLLQRCLLRAHQGFPADHRNT